MNMGFRIIWGHEMLQCAKRNGQLSSLQFGARSRQMATSCVLLKRASYDIIRLTRMTAIMFDNDATAAYDQMIPSQCMLVSVKNGVSEEEIQAKLTILKFMKYYVKTKYSVSVNYFCNSTLLVLLGLLQGSAAVGAIWAVNSSMLLDLLDAAFPKARFPSPRAHVYTERNSEAFVDDTSLWNTAMTQTLAALAVVAKQKAQRWENLVHVAGGGLNMLKNFYYAITWKWKPTGEAVMCTKDDNPDISISLTSGTDKVNRHAIPRIEITEGKRTIGVQLDPLGTDDTEYKYRLEQATSIRSRLLRAPLNKESTKIGFFSMILSKFS